MPEPAEAPEQAETPDAEAPATNVVELTLQPLSEAEPEPGIPGSATALSELELLEWSVGDDPDACGRIVMVTSAETTA